MSTGTRRLTVEALHQHLKNALRHGAKASRLLRHSLGMIELLCPAEEYSQMDAPDRALKAEELINRAIDAIGGQSGHAIAIILGLKVGALDHNLTYRRSLAAEHLGIQPETFRCPWREPALLHDLAMEIYRLHTNQSPAAAET